MAIQINSQVVDAIKVYRLNVTLTSIDIIPDPVAYVSQPKVWLQVLAIAGLPTLLFIGAKLLEEGFIGLERYYVLDMEFDETHVTATGHQHDRATLFLPLRESYRDGPYIDVDSTLGPVDIWSASDTIEYLRVRRQDGDDYLRVREDGEIKLGNDVTFLRDCEFDIGSHDDGATLRRPRDIYLCRDLLVGRNIEAQGYGEFGSYVQGTNYEFTQQVVNPDTNPAKRHIYWNSGDNTLRAWDGSVEFVIGGVSPVGPLTGTYNCPPAVSIGDAVSIVGGNTVDKADATILGLRPVIGIVVLKPVATTCVVQLYGEVAVFSGSLVPDQLYFLSQVPGTITNNTSGFNTGDTVQLVGVSKSSSVLTLRFESRVLY
jgi:hypothetical protein